MDNLDLNPFIMSMIDFLIYNVLNCHLNQALNNMSIVEGILVIGQVGVVIN